MKSEEAENKLRESEGTLAAVRSSEVKKLKEENEELYERLAFVEGEAEDYRNELNTEREQHREAMEEVQGDVNMLKSKLKAREEELELMKVDMSNIVEEEKPKQSDINDDNLFDGEEKVVDNAKESPPPTAESGTTSDEREEYIRTLEDELELVTEQLIEAETKLSQTQSELEEALVEAEQQSKKTTENGIMNGVESSASNDKHSDKIEELESSIKLLQEENNSLQEESKRLKEELELALEELALSREEIEAYELDRKDQATEFENQTKKHKEEMVAIQAQLDKLSSEDRSRDIESKSWEEALMTSKKETQTLQEEVEQLEKALKNSKSDCETMQEEIEALKVAFDDTANRERVESAGQHQALEELLATRTREVDELKEEVSNLSETNLSLTNMLKGMEDNLTKQQMEIEKQQKHVAIASESSSQELQDAQSEINSLQELLEATRNDLNEQRNEVVKVRTSLQEKIAHTEEELEIAQKELIDTQSKMLVVEKDRANSQPKIERLETDTEQRATTESSLQAKCDRLEEQNRMSVSMKNHLEDEIKQLQKQLLNANANAGDSNFKEQKNDPVQDLLNMDDTNVDDVLKSNDSEIIAKEFRSMAEKMNAQKVHNAELLTRILKLQGNIQVCCRIRPMSINECQEGLHEVAQSLTER